MNTAMLLGELSLAVGFLIVVTRGLLERLHELGLISGQQEKAGV